MHFHSLQPFHSQSDGLHVFFFFHEHLNFPSIFFFISFSLTLRNFGWFFLGLMSYVENWWLKSNEVLKISIAIQINIFNSTWDFQVTPIIYKVLPLPPPQTSYKVDFSSNFALKWQASEIYCRFKVLLLRCALVENSSILAKIFVIFQPKFCK